ncbi:MAG TPA: CHAT domain-containing protein [Thermoanaerobaculia bacterium]|nr:CHAT domain-containing protein [Thermoanaerobaculia bacterium]
MDYADFWLQIRSARRGFVVAARSPVGDVKAAFEPPFVDEEMESLLQGLRAAVRGARPATRHLLMEDDSAPRQTADELGIRLFRALFPEPIRDAYNRMVADGRRGFRIRLDLDLNDPVLAPLHSLPWELLCTPDRREFVALSLLRPIVRYLEVPAGAAAPPLPSTLRLLVVVAHPSHPDLEDLDVEQEREDLVEILSQRLGAGIEVDFLSGERAGVQHLRKALAAQPPYHALHFIGHGAVDPESDEGILYFERPGRVPEPVSGKRLASLLQGFPDLRLVVLNACDTARSGGTDPFAGVATALVQGGIPAVVAMQFPIPDVAAIELSRAFYERLTAGDPVDVAVQHGRSALHLGSPTGSFVWATPALFLRVPDGVLFALPPAGAESPARPRELLDRYLRWVVEQNQALELPDATLSGGRLAVPLTAVYVALRGDRSNPYERRRSRETLEREARQAENLPEIERLSPEERYRFTFRIIAQLSRHPVPAALEERGRPRLFGAAEDRSVSLGEAFRRERRLALLGDPGSGKTTLARWLALRLATACLQGEPRIRVPAHQVDPALEESADEMDLGPARVPILVRIAAYAKARRERPGLSLAAFLGHHLGSGWDQPVTDSRGRALDPASLHLLLLDLLETGRAVVLLDGLDEVSDPADRYEVAREIDRFLESWLPDEPPRGMPAAIPAEAGGNQAVITSRIVGYEMAPLSGEATHLTIEPMGPVAIDRFCAVWMRAVHRAQRSADRWDGEAEAEAARQAVGLQRAIADLKERGAEDLASNPLLITILGVVYRSGQERFPRQRVELYRIAIGLLLHKWRQRARLRAERELGDEEILGALEPLAAEIHETSGIGVVDEAGLRRALSRTLAPADAEALRSVLREEVGLLTARGEGIYGFLHLTFQEYLAACALVRDRTGLADRLLEKLSAPRWREPVLMALGQLSAELYEGELRTLLLGLLERPEPLGHLVPRTALLLTAALPEMVRVPAGVIERIAGRLLAAYADRSLRDRFPSLGEKIERAFLRLSRGEHVAQVERLLCRELAGSETVGIAAAAGLVRACRLQSADLAAALTAALPRDSAEDRWPVDAALRQLAGADPRLLPPAPGSLRSILLARQDLADRFLADPAWVRLGIALYGGLDSGLPERLAPKQTELTKLREEKLAAEKRKDDPAAGEALQRLGQDIEATVALLCEWEERGHRLAIERMHRDSPLTPGIVAALQEALPPSSLVPRLLQLAGEPGPAAAEALLALAAIGEPIPLPREAVARLSRVEDALRPVVPISVKRAVDALARLSEECPAEKWGDLLTAVIGAGLAFGMPTVDVRVLVSSYPTELRGRIMAELWSSALAGAGSDPIYDLAVILDTMGNVLSDPPLVLAYGLATAHRSANGRWEGTRWMLDRLTLRVWTEPDLLAEALDALAIVPEGFNFFRGWALGRLASLLRQAPGMRLEAILCAIGSLLDDHDLRRDTLKTLAGEEAGWMELLIHPAPFLKLLPQVREVSDPWWRFRCYRRLLLLFPDLRIDLLAEEANKAGENAAGWWQRLTSYLASYVEVLAAEAPAAAGAIQNPIRRAWAFEQLAALGSERGEWLRRARRTAQQILHRESRARTLGRLASYFPPAEAHDLLKQALRDTATILGPREKAETLISLRDALAGFPDLQGQLEKVARSLKDPWLRAQALGSEAPILLTGGYLLAEGGTDPEPLGLALLLRDLQRLALPSDLPGIWMALAGDRREEALAELRERACQDWLRPTREAVLVLNRLLASGGLDTVLSLLPRMRNPAPEALPLLETWLIHADPRLRRYANFLVAEAEGFSERTIPGLLEALGDSDDLARYRAALVLHGDRTGTERRISTSLLGMDTVELLAEHCLELRERDPRSALVINWTFERLVHSDGRALESWADRLDRGAAGWRKADCILKQVHKIDSHAWPVFRERLRQGGPAVQRALLHSLCLLAYRQTISPDQWSEVAPLLREIPAEAGDEEFLLDGAEALVDVAESVWNSGSAGESPPRDELLALAERELAARTRRLSETLRQDPAEAAQTLRAIGDIQFASGNYSARITAAAQRVERNPQVLEFLIDWLALRLQTKLLDPGGFRLLTGEMLALVAASAERLPNTYYAKASGSTLLARKLREAAELHNTFTGRQAALTLLSFLRRLTAHATAALRSGLRDVIDVQATALGTIDRYREIDPDLLPELFRDLHDPSAATGFATGQMLAAIARNAHLDPGLRRLVAEGIAAAIEDPRLQCEVYIILKKQYQEHHIEHQGRLDRILYKVFMELSGLADLGDKSAG